VHLDLRLVRSVLSRRLGLLACLLGLLCVRHDIISGVGSGLFAFISERIDLIGHNVFGRVESSLLYFLLSCARVDGLLSSIESCQHHLTQHRLKALLLDDAPRRVFPHEVSGLQMMHGAGPDHRRILLVAVGLKIACLRMCRGCRIIARVCGFTRKCVDLVLDDVLYGVECVLLCFPLAFTAVDRFLRSIECGQYDP